MSKYLAFTLAEVLIALALLGVVAAFTIPKVLQSVQDAKLKPVFKENLAVLYEVQQKARREGLLPEGFTATDYAAFIRQNVQYLKSCSGNVVSEGCAIDRGGNDMMGVGHANVASNGGGIILPNNSLWAGLGNVFTIQGTRPGYMYMDINGPTQGTNQEAEDQICLAINMGNILYNNSYDVTGDLVQGWGRIQPGQVVPCANRPESVAFFNRLIR